MPTEPSPSDEFVALFVANQRRIHGFIATLLPNAADAEEVLQATGIVAWRKFGDFQPGTDFVRWACTVARYEVMTFLREKRRGGLIFDDALLEDLADRQSAANPQLEARHQALSDCIGKLRPNDRDLLRRCYADDTTFKQVAVQLNRPLNTVYKTLQRIRSNLLECILRTLSQEEAGA